MNGHHAHILIKPRVYHIFKIGEVAGGEHQRGQRAGHKDFEGWLAELVLHLKQEGYALTVERNDSPK